MNMEMNGEPSLMGELTTFLLPDSEACFIITSAV